jgi:hypothetical protein
MNGKRRLTLMCYYIFMYVFMGVQPLISIWSGRFPHSEILFSETKISFTIWMVILGIIFFELGYFRLYSEAKVIRSNKDLLGYKNARPTNISLAALWISVTIVSCMVVLSILRYGPNIYLGLRDGGFSVGDSQGPESTQTENLLVIFGLRGLSATLLFVTIYFWKVRKIVLGKKQIWRLKVALIYLILFNIIVSNPLNAPRLWSGSVLLTSLFLSLTWKGSRSFLTWSSVACVSLLLLFSGTDPRRIFGQQLLRGENITVSNTVKEVVVAIQNIPADLNFDAFQMISYTRDYTTKFGFSWGNQILLPAFFWVPRALWPGKPIGTPDIVAADADFLSINVSSPLWAEGYINFGVAGTVLFLFILGYCSRLCDDSLVKTYTRPATVTIITCFFAANTFILLRGDLTSGTMYLQMIMVITWLFLLLIRRTNKSHVPN